MSVSETPGLLDPDEDVFRPRISLSRSPLASTRRKRSITYSSSKDGSVILALDAKKQKTKHKHDGNRKNVTEIMDAIHSACSTIEDSISKESNHKIQFNKGDRDACRVSLSSILKDCNVLMAVAIEALNKCTNMQTLCIERDGEVGIPQYGLGLRKTA